MAKFQIIGSLSLGIRIFIPGENRNVCERFYPKITKKGTY